MTPEERQEIRERHVEVTVDFRDVMRCMSDGYRWPCDTARLLADYDHLVEDRDELAEFVNHPLVPKADYDHLVEAINLTAIPTLLVFADGNAGVRQAIQRLRAAAPDGRSGRGRVTNPDLDQRVQKARRARALIDPATPEPVEGEPNE
jgi:hypothetical protein